MLLPELERQPCCSIDNCWFAGSLYYRINRLQKTRQKRYFEGM